MGTRSCHCKHMVIALRKTKAGLHKGSEAGKGVEEARLLLPACSVGGVKD